MPNVVFKQHEALKLFAHVLSKARHQTLEPWPDVVFRAQGEALQFLQSAVRGKVPDAQAQVWNPVQGPVQGVRVLARCAIRSCVPGA